jgi:hypothetical protein
MFVIMELLYGTRGQGGKGKENDSVSSIEIHNICADSEYNDT